MLVSPDSYHHGSLRRALLDEVAVVVAERGVEAVTFRGLAATLDVSHTAPAHHFGTRRGLLTAFAAEGFDVLAEALESASAPFIEQGMAYVDFALAHPSHFAVMFDVSVLDPDDPEFARARGRAFEALRGGVATFAAEPTRPGSDALDVATAAWGMMHGIVTLARSGMLGGPHLGDHIPDDDLRSLARRAALLLTPPRSPDRPSPETNHD